MTPADRIIELYERRAADFEAERFRALFEKSWLDRFAALLPAGGTILDLGCGMGEPIARHFIEAGFRLSGVDSSAAMIEACGARFPGHDWVVSDMRGLALGRRFHGIIAWNSFFHLAQDDQRAMFPVFAAHAAPGAALMFTSGPEAGVAMGSWHGEPLFHASLDPDEYRALLAASSFEVVRFVPEDPECGGHTVWLARAAG